MFNSEELDLHLKTSHTIETESLVFAEWNMNDTDNINKVGNYRYRPQAVDNQFSIPPSTYDDLDIGGYYTGATDSDITVQSGFDDQDNPTLFTSTRTSMGLLYSLDDCLKPQRPRAGINKMICLGENSSQYFDMGDQITSQEVLNISRRPRYYMSSRYDQFKYWTSYRTAREGEEGVEFGISKAINANGLSYIDDSCPFVVYKEVIPTNKIVVKMQTNVGDIDLGPFTVDGEQIDDPLYGYKNQTTPQRWKIEILKENSWVPIIKFDENSLDKNGNPVVESDGYLEVSYGMVVPEQYRNDYVYAGEIEAEYLLPEVAPYGYLYLIKSSDTDPGIFKIYDDGWDPVSVEYGWSLTDDALDIRTPVVTKATDPEYFINAAGKTQFREFEFIQGMRIVVETMNNPETMFDLIEMSPRLVVNVSDKVSSISLTKTMSDLGNGSIPVGSISASTGSIQLFDDDFSFNQNNIFNHETNLGSIIANHISTKIKFDFYQMVKNVDRYNYFIPIKKMYTDGIPVVSSSTGLVDISLRDLFFFLESSKAPELLITDASISYAITLILDHIGFSNYVFKRVQGLPEIIIPFFFVSPDQNVAEVLQKLAVASQTAIFFDEYNNLVVMSKEYLLPEKDQRNIDSTLYGQQVDANLPNIINLSSEEKKIYNDGRVNYTTRYIQRALSKYKQAPYTDKYKTIGYKPSLLWEVSAKEQLRSQNELPQQSGGFSLSAAPLSVGLTADLPVVVNKEIINNVISLDEGIDNVSSYQGYFYANGEIIKYDAMEYAITGALDDGQPGNLRWITSSQEYQRYFSRIPFNGKMYATGNIRIFSEPEYETVNGVFSIKNGSVKKHGRGQFDTPITSHDAGINSYWSDNSNVAGCLQKGKDYLFNTSEIIEYPALSLGVAGKIEEDIEELNYFNSDLVATDSTRNGIIKNFRADKYFTENEVNYFNTTRAGTLQASALVFNGPAVPEQINPADFVSYVYKDLPDKYTHFGTRMRIIGKIESTNQKSQTPYGGFPIYQTQDLDINSPEKNIQILGGSGGVAFGLNKETNNGYYFEIVSLTQDNIDSYTGSNKEKVVSYPIISSSPVSASSNTVTAKTERPITFLVGEKVRISGLVDNNYSDNTNTPLNGEYKITALNTDKKSFQYVIPTPSQTSVTITDASGDGNLITFNIPSGDTRDSYFKAGDKISISGSSNSSFNLTNVIVNSFRQLGDGWYFTVKSTVTGTSTGGSATYVPLTTTSKTGGTVAVSQSGENNIANIFFYKVLADENGKAIPYKLWSGLGKIIVDDGKFTGQYRFVGEENPTVFDLSAEYINIGNARRFFLYINGKSVATVTDEDPLPEYNNMALFVRGTSKCMFENIYALGVNIGQQGAAPLNTPISKVFGDDEVDTTEALRKYAISGVIQKTYLSGISGDGASPYTLYFDEFGTIMREAAYLNIKYDRAFPALRSRIMKTFNGLKGYSVSGFFGGSYGADFLIFNCQDTTINLDDTTGNFLRIQGIAFTQQTTKTLTVDDYYKRISNISDPITDSSGSLVNPFIEKEEYNRILNSRSRYGTNEFTIESDYIQTDEAAEDVFGWTLQKISVPKIVVGLNTFATFNLQLGDIINIDYKNNEGLDIISDKDKRFVVYNIEYSKSLGNENMVMYLVEA